MWHKRSTNKNIILDGLQESRGNTMQGGSVTVYSRRHVWLHVTQAQTSASDDSRRLFENVNSQSHQMWFESNDSEVRFRLETNRYRCKTWIVYTVRNKPKHTCSIRKNLHTRNSHIYKNIVIECRRHSLTQFLPSLRLQQLTSRRKINEASKEGI